MGENQMLKKLYQNNAELSSSRMSQSNSFKLKTNMGLADKKTHEKRAIKKHYSTNELKTSNMHLKNSYY
jgi:hypothetical protein